MTTRAQVRTLIQMYLVAVGSMQPTETTYILLQRRVPVWVALYG